MYVDAMFFVRTIVQIRIIPKAGINSTSEFCFFPTLL